MPSKRAHRVTGRAWRGCCDVGPAVVQMVLPSMLAAQADGQGRFDVEAETLEEALRSLPVADLLFNERGEWNRYLNAFVDGTGHARPRRPRMPARGNPR